MCTVGPINYAPPPVIIQKLPASKKKRWAENVPSRIPLPHCCRDMVGRTSPTKQDPECGSGSVSVNSWSTLSLSLSFSLSLSLVSLSACQVFLDGLRCGTTTHDIACMASSTRQKSTQQEKIAINILWYQVRIATT